MQARALTIRLLRLAMAASLLVPLLLVALTAWTSYRDVKLLADERIVRSLDLQEQQACLVLLERTIRSQSVLDLFAQIAGVGVVQDPLDLRTRPQERDDRRHSARHG